MRGAPLYRGRVPGGRPSGGWSRRRRVEEVGDEAAATHACRVAVTGPDAQVLPDGEGRHMVVGRSGEEPIHVLFLQPRVLQGAGGCLPDQVERRETRPDLPEVRLGHPNDSRPTPQAHPADSAAGSAGTKTATGPSSSSRTSNRTRRPTPTSSAETPSTRLIIRKPSSRATSATV